MDTVNGGRMGAVTLKEVAQMPIVIEGLDEAVEQRIALRAKQRGHSVEDEARSILMNAMQLPNIGVAFMRAAQKVGGFDDLLIPERSDIARAADFS
jgi:plasmid stability protein